MQNGVYFCIMSWVNFQQVSNEMTALWPEHLESNLVNGWSLDWLNDHWLGITRWHLYCTNKYFNQTLRELRVKTYIWYIPSLTRKHMFKNKFAIYLLHWITHCHKPHPKCTIFSQIWSWHLVFELFLAVTVSKLGFVCVHHLSIWPMWFKFPRPMSDHLL